MIYCQAQKLIMTTQGPWRLEVDFKVLDGETMGLFGASGAGKTTILRMIAGLLNPDKGYIEVNGQVWFDSSIKFSLPISKRSLGFVFQDYQLFDHMTVRENLAYALTCPDQNKIIDGLRRMGLSGLEHQKPYQISGGQKQRVALLRALLRDPSILLLDEPLSALDKIMRIQMQELIAEILKVEMQPAILVSHDIGEVYRLCQKVIFLEQGRVLKEGTPDEVFAGQHLNGQVQLNGTIIDLQGMDFMYIVTIASGGFIYKVMATEEDAKDWQRGDEVLIMAKGVNPIIKKLSSFSPR